MYEDSVTVGQLASQSDMGDDYLDFNGSIGRTLFPGGWCLPTYGLPTSWRSTAGFLSRVFTPNSMTTRDLDRTTDHTGV
ncbi:MAG: hypothetical protein U5L96_15315 [Owenweeksia sp.]|nr:hypothetical protein [Owenweeksia sp.]